MSLKTSHQKYILDFKFDAGTSRGVLKEKQPYFIKVWNPENEQVYGLGECSPLSKLSVDDREDFGIQLAQVLKQLEEREMPQTDEEIYTLADELAGKDLPAIRFALETALLDLLNGGNRIIFKNSFVQGDLRIPINGLIWMGPMESMLSQASEKIAAGYACIKMKIGSLDFQNECDILNFLRTAYNDRGILLRLDANGAFQIQDALEKITQLEQFQVHSIEQPIAPGQWEEMERLCRSSPIEIALDEELIGSYTIEEKKLLLQKIRPQYIILKPTLLGGIRSCQEWMKIAESMGIGWWLTSALESNIGLNVICQFAVEANAAGYQGLGTGQLYHNNINSPLQIENGHIYYDQKLSWDFSNLTL